MRPGTRALRGRAAKLLAGVVIGVPLLLIAGLLAGVAPAAVPAQAAVARGSQAGGAPRHFARLVPVRPRLTPNLDQTRGRRYTATETRWPGAASAVVALAAPRGAARAAAAAGAGTPAWAQAVAPAHGAYQGPASVGLQVESQAAAQRLGIRGVVWQVSGLTAGSGGVRAGLSYKGFAQAFGGNYGLRLTLVQLPACALATPQLARCRTQVPLATVNDAKTSTVSAVLPLPGGSTSSRPVAASGARPAVSAGGAVVLAATSTAGGEGGPAGTYGATSLKPSGSWAAGGSTGSFTYSYPVELPGASSSLTPSVGLTYDSGSVDGQTAATEAQAGWAGDGWSTGDSYVEQSFVPCADNPEGNTTLPAADQTEDMCYDGNVVTLSLKGSTTSLVYDSTHSTWRLQDDDGATVTKVTTGTGTGLSAEVASSSDTSYWVVTERDGTSYYFGYDELPGWASGDKITSSVDYEPVYSANSGDPCNKPAGFTSSVCAMPYRWHLDYVTDRHGDAMSYYYHQDTNYYGEDQGASTVKYVRDSNLTEADWGFRAGQAYSATAIPDKAVYDGTGLRCFASSCPAISSSNSGTPASAYPDVPYDLNCAQGSTCTIYGPTFWSTARLLSITTEQYNGSAFTPVDVYTLGESEPPSGDGTSPTLWLASIQREGEDTTAGGSTSGITLPPVTFGGIDKPNRVDSTNFPALERFRIDQVISETGAKTSVSYGTPYPCSASYVDGMTTSASAAGNTESCYPVWWQPPAYNGPIMDWFEKYAVTSVTTTDQTGGAEDLVSQYQYSGGAAWHYDDNEVVKKKYRTYGQFRGYGTVTTLTGAGTTTEPQAKAVTTYYRGMSDDNNTTAVTLTDSQGGTHDDASQLAGMPLETTVYTGANGAVDHTTITSYWISPATAARSRTSDGLPDLTANMVEPAEAFTAQALTDGGTTTWRDTEADTTYDAITTDDNFGLPLYAYTHTVPAQAAYDRCATTTYAPANKSENLAGLVASAETDAVACGGFTEGSGKGSAPSGLNTLTGAPSTIKRPDQVVSATETLYDGATTFPQTAPPTTGNVTQVMKAAGYSGTTAAWPSWQTTSRYAAFDSYGRAQDAYDGNGKDTVTSYTVNAAGLTTGVTVTNPLSQATTMTLDPVRGATLTTTNPNGVVTTEQYDALGRLTSVWLDSRVPASVEANYTYAYTVCGTTLTVCSSGISGVVAKTMGDAGGYATTVTVLDSLGRTRQVQTDTPSGGRLLTDSFYDSHGWVRKKINQYFDGNSTPALPSTISDPADSVVPDYDVYTFNGLGQVVQDASMDVGNVVSTTTTVYNGDRVTVIPPAGGVIKSTVTDPLGQTSEVDEYPSASAAPVLHTPSDTFAGTWYLTGGTTAATTYGYAPTSAGYKTTITDAGSHAWTTTDNLLGEITSSSDPDSGSVTGQAYDGNGNLLKQTTPEGTVQFTYDALNRKTAEFTGTGAQVTFASSPSTSNEIASWAYDNSDGGVPGMAYPIGHLTDEYTYSSQQAYRIQQAGFNVFGEPTGETYTIPSNSSDTGVSGSYGFTHYWTTGTGLALGQKYPAVSAAGLPLEGTTITYRASPLDLPSGLGGTVAGYAASTTYDAWGNVLDEQIGSGTTNLADINSTYDAHTLQLKDQLVQRHATTPANVDEETYGYDLAGNLTSQVSERLGSAADSETQCFQYNGIDQLTQAWTAKTSCTTTPTSANVTTTVGDGISSASAYWTSWAYDTGNAASDILGDITSQVQHSLTSGTDTTTANTYGGTSGGPHALTTAATTGGATATSTFGYDAAGNMTSRKVAATGTQTLHWNAAGQLTSITGGTNGTTSYVYAPDGTLLLQVDQGSSTASTVYLDGEQLTATTSGTTTTVKGARIIALPGGGDVVRTGATTSYYFEIPDPHGTNDLYLDNTAQTPTWRQFTPYGAPRGTPVTWIDNRGFLNKPNDTAAGLTYLGPRAYDPATSQFTSPDPILTPTDPQDLNPYAYAQDNPVGNSDPTGLHICWGDSGCNPPPPGAINGPAGPCGCGSSPNGGGSSNLIPISPTVSVQPGDPRAAPLAQTYNDYLRENNILASRVTKNQDYAIWYQICEFTHGVCPSALYEALRQYFSFGSSNQAVAAGAVFAIGSSFSSIGGALAIPGNLTPMGQNAYIRAYQIYNSPQFSQVKEAASSNNEAHVRIAGTDVYYAPDLRASGFSLQPDGFALGRPAFTSQEELVKTLLHESYRLAAAVGSGGAGVSGEDAAKATNDAFNFAESNFEILMANSPADDFMAGPLEGGGDGGGGE